MQEVPKKEIIIYNKLVEAASEKYAPLEKCDGTSIYSMSAVRDIQRKSYVKGANSHALDHPVVKEMAEALERLKSANNRALKIELEYTLSRVDIVAIADMALTKYHVVVKERL